MWLRHTTSSVICTLYSVLCIVLCPHRLAKLYPSQIDINHNQRSRKPQHRSAERRVVADVVRAVVRTVVRTIGSRTVRVVEDPRGRRRNTPTTQLQTTSGNRGFSSDVPIPMLFVTWETFFQSSVFRVQITDNEKLIIH